KPATVVTIVTPPLYCGTLTQSCPVPTMTARVVSKRRSSKGRWRYRAGRFHLRICLQISYYGTGAAGGANDYEKPEQKCEASGERLQLDRSAVGSGDHHRAGIDFVHQAGPDAKAAAHHQCV